MLPVHEAELARCPSVRTPQRAPRPLLSSRPHAWDGVLVEIYRARDMDFVAAHSEHVISLQIEGSSDLPQHVAALGSPGRIRAGSTVDITPAGVSRHWRCDGEAEIMLLHIVPSLVESIAAEENRHPAERVELVVQRGIRDARIERLGARFLEELVAGGFASRTCVKLLANLLAIHLLRHYSTSRESTDAPSGKLAMHKLRQATDYINKNLRDDLSLGRISEVLCMSPCHFAHVFKQTTGDTPHRYVADCRMEKAKYLLRETKFSVSAIAQMVGYSSQSYFSTVFRQFTGQSPLRYRDDA
jgi:AraC family transcriptional regulator